MDSADSAETQSIRRFARFDALWHAIVEAEREAEAYLRLEEALGRTGLESGGGAPSRGRAA